MHKIYTLVMGIFTFSCSFAMASQPVDSIGVENYKGNKLILHKVEAKETYYAISRIYKIPYQEIMTFNDNKMLGVGVVIKVPTKIPFNGNYSGPSTANATAPTASFEYTIQKKDNLNLLAERYGTTVNAIKEANNLKSINLQIGQVLRIPGKENIESYTDQVSRAEKQPVEKPIETLKIPAKQTIEHTVKKKEFLGSIAKQYDITVDELKRINNLTSNNLQIGQVLVISKGTENNTSAQAEQTAKVNSVNTERVDREVKKAQEKAEKEAQEKAEDQRKATEKAQQKSNKENGFEYTVGDKETIYSIAKKFKVTTYQIQKANNLDGTSLKTGQKIVINAEKPVAEVMEVTADSEEASNDSNLKDPSLRLPASRYGLSQVEEKGAGVWIEDKDLDASKMLILHRSAPVGTVIKITNPMNNRSTFAKVVGKFTENEATKDVIIVMTKAVAEAVGALDKRFYCNLTYGVQQENVQ